MTNWEKAKEEFSIEDVGNGGFCEAIHRIRHEKSCDNRFCDKCAKWLAEEYEEPILTKSEKEYLSAVIKPFRDKVKYITKRIDTGVPDTEFIKIILENHNLLQLPRFERRTMYKGMEICACYSLDNLGL